MGSPRLGELRLHYGGGSLVADPKEVAAARAKMDRHQELRRKVRHEHALEARDALPVVSRNPPRPDAAALPGTSSAPPERG